MALINGVAKNIIKSVVPSVVLKNFKGLSEAITSYYPQYLFGNGRIKTLKHVSIEVTFRCNCRCQMCPLYGVQVDGGKELINTIKEEKELTLEEFSKLFIELKEGGTCSVNFTGGEAFLRSDILDITRLAKEAGLEVSFTSNGGLINKEIAKVVVELGVDEIIFSLDGPKRIHEGIRKANIFDRIMAAVDYIEEEKKRQNKPNPSMNFLCTVSILNQNHLSELVGITKEKGLPLTIDPIIFTTEEDWEATKSAFNNGFIKKENFVMPDTIGKVNVDLLEKELEKVFLLAKDIGQPVYVSIADKETRRKFFDDPKYSIANKCFAPWYSCRIDPYGNVYPCSLSISMGNIRESNMRDIINGDKFVSFRKRLKENRLFPFCNKCCVLYSHNSFWNCLPKI